MTKIEQTLKQNFGYNEFRLYQKNVIESVLENKSSLAVFPTGAGKSLCFQLPAILMESLTLVVSPLIALMKDQVDALKKKGINAERLDSTLSLDDYQNLIQSIKENKIKILYVSPERFNNEIFRNFFHQIPISLFVIDEAHCISEWGHNFRPDYLKLPIYAKEFGAKTLLALTATAKQKVQQDICDSLSIKKEHAFISGFYRENLNLLFSVFNDKDHQKNDLINKINSRETGSTIIYVTLQKTAEDLSNELNQNGISSQAYHAGMDNEERKNIQEWFIESNEAIIVSTIAFGMGIDKSNIRYVYHYNLPKSLESYSQEIGRSGRDNKTSYCEVFANAEDINILENFIYGDMPNYDDITQFISYVFSFENLIQLKLITLSREYDIKVNVIKTILTHLELKGFIKSKAPIYTEYKFIPLKSSKEILELIPDSDKYLVTIIFKNIIKRTKYFDVNLDHLINTFNLSRIDIINTLNMLNDLNMIDLTVKGLLHEYHYVNKSKNIDIVSKEIYDFLKIREAAELNRISNVINLINSNECQSKLLSNYFGEILEKNCGKCSYCLSNKKLNLTRNHISTSWRPTATT